MYLRKQVMQTVKTYSFSAIIAFGIVMIATSFVNGMLLYYSGGILFLTSVLAPTVSKWMPKKRISPDKKAVFITGCDRGFGYMLAQRLDDLGFHVFAGCLFPDGDGASSLRKSGSNRLHVIGLDVTSDSSVSEAVSYVKENLKDNVLWAVVNNAGIGSLGELHWMSIKEIQRTIEVNTLGVVRVTKAFLSELKESKGRILTVASTAGRYTSPGLVPYCMSKAAVISFCDILRLEMYKFGIQVITIEPTFYRTAIIGEEFVKAALQTWENAPADVKALYKSSYVENSINRFLRLTARVAGHPSEVVSVMEGAITALYPEYSYSPGNLTTHMVIWILLHLPKPIADMLMYYFTQERHID